MSPTRSPTLRQMKSFLADPRYWDDADLAPAARPETPLEAWA
jgi:hypothetical protein